MHPTLNDTVIGEFRPLHVYNCLHIVIFHEADDPCSPFFYVGHKYISKTFRQGIDHRHLLLYGFFMLLFQPFFLPLLGKMFFHDMINILKSCNNIIKILKNHIAVLAVMDFSVVYNPIGPCIFIGGLKGFFYIFKSKSLPEHGPIIRMDTLGNILIFHRFIGVNPCLSPVEAGSNISIELHDLGLAFYRIYQVYVGISG